MSPPRPKTQRSSATSAAVLLVLSLAILLATLVPSDSDREPKPMDATLFPAALQAKSPLGDRVFVSDENAANASYAFGRWKEPVKNLRFHVDEDWKLRLQAALRTKHWHYTSINTEKYFIGAAVVKLGYASDAFVYVVDKTASDAEKFEFAGRLPGSLGLTFASSPVDDKVSTCTSFTSLTSETISFCYESETSEWRIRTNVTLVGANSQRSLPFTADLRLKREEALTLLFPLGNDTLRPAYVHKAAGSPVSGSFQLGSIEVQVDKSSALGAIDWTRSLALRCTRWNWASSSFKAKVTTTVKGQPPQVDEHASVGINLSRFVYDINDESQENAIWINGRVHVLRGVEFSVPKSTLVSSDWLVKPSSSVPQKEQSVQLRFSPSGGSREDHTRLLVFESDFVQPYGVFNGEISISSDDGMTRTIVQVKNAFGVVEDHFALW